MVKHNHPRMDYARDEKQQRQQKVDALYMSWGNIDVNKSDICMHGNVDVNRIRNDIYAFACNYMYSIVKLNTRGESKL